MERRRKELDLFKQVEMKVLRIASTADSVTIALLISAFVKTLNKLVDLFWLKIREESRQVGRTRKR